MDCDRCGREIEGGALVGIGARRFRNLCRTCWAVETRSSNSRLISALNEMTREVGQGASKSNATDAPKPDAVRRAMRAAQLEDEDRRQAVVERRQDPERPRWHP